MWLTAPAVGGLLFPQREALGFDPRESTPGLNAKRRSSQGELRSFQRVSTVMDRVFGPGGLRPSLLILGMRFVLLRVERWRLAL